MAQLKGNNAEGGTATVTVTAGNSGGASGDAVTPTIGTGASNTFEAAGAAHGTLGYQISTTATASTCFDTWVLSVAKDHIYGSIYIKVPTWAVASTSTYTIRFKGAGTQACRMCFTTSGFIKISDTATLNPVNGSVGANVGSHFRLDYELVVSTGTFTVWLFNSMDAPIGSHVDSITGTGKSFGANPIDTIDVGIVGANANIGPWYWDDHRISDTAVPGPVAVDVTVTDTGTLALNLVSSETISIDTVINDASTTNLGLATSNTVAADLVASDVGTVGLALSPIETVMADVVITDTGVVSLAFAVAGTLAIGVVVTDTPAANLSLATVDSVSIGVLVQDSASVNLGLLGTEFFDVVLLDSSSVNLCLQTEYTLRNGVPESPSVFVDLATKTAKVDLATKTKAIDLATKRVVITLKQ